MVRTVPTSNLTDVPTAFDEYPLPLPGDFFIVAVVFLSVQIAVGLPGNLKVFLRLQKRKTTRKVPEVLLWNLSLVGVLVSGVYVPLFLAILVTNQLSEPVRLVFVVVHYSLSISVSCWQSLNLVAMAVDRYDAVHHPHKRRITSANVFKVVKGIWVIVGLTMATHGALAVRDILEYEVVFQLPSAALSMLFTLVLANFLLVVTVVVILFTFGRIVKRLRSLPFQSNAGQRSDILVSRLTYTVLFSFLASWLPLIVVVIVNRVFAVNETTFKALRVVLLAASNTNYVVNPFVHMRIVRAAHRRTAPRRRTNARAGAEPRPDEQAGAEPRQGARAGAKPRPDEQAGAEPRQGARAGAEPRPDQRAGTESRPDEQAGAEPRPDEQAGAEPRPNARAGAEPRLDKRARAELRPNGRAGAEPRLDERAGAKSRPNARAWESTTADRH